MSCEWARVVALADDGVWVEAVQRSACNSCQAKNGCGQKTLADIGRPMRLWVACQSDQLQVGDDVELTLPTGGLALSALVAYGIPLLLLLTSAVLFSAFGELASVLASGVGLLLGLLFARKLSQRFSHVWLPTIRQPLVTHHL